MNKLILNLKKLIKTFLYKKKKINNININILYNNNIKYSNITIILPLPLIFKKKKKIYYKICEIIINKYKKYFIKYSIKNCFLNFFLNNYFYINVINKFINIDYNIDKLILNKKNNKKLIIVEFSSPNSNKPLHIGHLRNILIGDTISNIYKSLGYKVIKSQIINDRGIHICKTIISLKLFFKNKTPSLLNIKGDYFVGKLYFKFEKKLKSEIKYLSKKYNINNKKKILNKSKLLKKVNNELLKWEKKNKKTIFYWKLIKSWVLKGFKKTYKKLNIKFDETIYESKIYLKGKKIIKKCIKNNKIFFKKNKSVFFLFKKKYKILLLRSNGTSLYITQDIGSIIYRLKKYKKIYLLIYVVGNEQIFHFKVLFNIIKKLNLLNNNNNIKLYHLSYNTVNYLGKKIKSRYNKKNIIFIDYLIKKMYKYVKNKINKKKNLNKITIGTIKYQFIKINFKKIINFNFKSSLNLKGNTYIYIQYTYVRIYSILKKNNKNIKNNNIKKNKKIKENEKKIIIDIINYLEILKKTIKNYDPSILTNYIYFLSKKINNFYQKNKILTNNLYKKNLRLNICIIILKILYKSMKILNIPILKKM
ncbi:MAG: arginine--tRNA ligase [Candidatus Shikimatogenerans bostrichidophilus]|nr:MAG: arginine--tRNA ligase [Candidatus Shikimatogenerans bostrichidophilus]